MPHILGSLVDLNHPGRYIHWGFIQMSVANALVIGLMLVVFVLALVLPFPHGTAVATQRAAPPASRTVDEHTEAVTEP
jgi:hypothetical protein